MCQVVSYVALNDEIIPKQAQLHAAGGEIALGGAASHDARRVLPFIRKRLSAPRPTDWRAKAAEDSVGRPSTSEVEPPQSASFPSILWRKLIFKSY